MKICLIHVKENWTPVPPMGITIIGTLLKQSNHKIMILDINIQEKEKYTQKIKDFKPDLIGFSVMTTAYSITKEFTSYIRKQLKDRALLCWGGVHPTALPTETLLDNNLDFVVYGEGEYALLEIADKFDQGNLKFNEINGIVFKGDINGKETILKTPSRQLIQDLDKLPIPDRSLLDNFKWYLSPPGILRGKFYYGITTMYTSRGCPYKCIFCASKSIHGSNIRRRSVGNVIEEMVYLKGIGVKGIYFNDDTFATDMDWLKEFCSKVKLLNMVWGCQTRANIAQDMEMLQMIKDAGCVQVDIGAESGSQKILNTLKKGITIEQIKKSFENLKKVKMKTFATFILGNPGETIEDVKMTEELARLAPGGVSFLILVPYPGCELYSMAKENSWFLGDIKFNDSWTNKQSDQPVMSASKISPSELVLMRAKLQNKFFWKNNILTLIAFLKSPKFLFQALKTVFGHPIFISRSLYKAVKKRKAMDFLEDVYQKFNEDMRK